MDSIPVVRLVLAKDGKGYIESSSNLAAVKAWTAIKAERWLDRGKMFVRVSDPLIEELRKKGFEIVSAANTALPFPIEAMNKSKLPPRVPMFAWREADELTPPGYTGPREHQVRGFKLCAPRDWGALFMDMGTGKTFTTIHVLAEWWRTNQISRAIIIAPNGVHLQWLMEQLPMWMPKWCPYTACEIKSQKPPPTDWYKFDGLAIALTNIETLSTGFGESRVKDLMKGGETALVIDESTRIKTPGAERTKTAMRIGKLARKRLILSGQPVTKGVEDLFAQCKFLSPTALPHTSFTAFKAYYCMLGGWENKKIVGYQKLDELTAQVSRFSLVVRREDCLDLPPKTYTTQSLDLDPAQKKAYKAMKEELIVVLDQIREINELERTRGLEKDERETLIASAANAAAGLIRLQQIACGWLPTEDGGFHEFNTNRAKLAADLVEEAPGKTIVFTRFRHDVDLVSAELEKRGIGFRKYYGDVKVAERRENLDDFKGDQDVKVLVGTGAAGGIGLNLAHANTMIYYANDFNFETRDQSEARVWRMGQTQKVLYVDLIAAPVDRLILKTLGERRTVSDAVRMGIIAAEDL